MLIDPMSQATIVVVLREQRVRHGRSHRALIENYGSVYRACVAGSQQLQPQPQSDQQPRTPPTLQARSALCGTMHMSGELISPSWLRLGILCGSLI